MNEGFSSRIEERLKRLLDELEIPPPVPEQSPVVESASSASLPQELVRTYYPALDLYIHAELPQTSTLPALSIPFSLNGYPKGKITFYKTDTPFHEIEEGFVKNILETLVSHLNALSKELRTSSPSHSGTSNESPPLQWNNIQGKSLAFWDGECMPVFSQAAITPEKDLATLKTSDGILGAFDICLNGTPLTQQNHEFLFDILETLRIQIIQLGYQQITQKIIQQKQLWEEGIERLINAKSSAEILALFCEIVILPEQAFLWRYEKSSDAFEMISQWHPQPHTLVRRIPADILLKTVFYPTRVLRIPKNSEIPNTLKDLKALLQPEKGLLLIPLISRDEPEGCIVLITSDETRWENINEQEVLQLAKVAALVLHRLSR